MSSLAGKQSRFYRLDLFSLVTRFYLGLWVVVTVIPALRLVGLSLRSPGATGENILYVIPRSFTLRNFVDAFPFLAETTVSLPRAFLNSALYSLGAVTVALIASMLASFAFATMRFRGKHLLFTTLLLSLVVPTSAMLLPEYITVGQLGLRNTAWALILPYVAFSIAMPTLVMTSFFKRVPQELYDAAKIDGCTPFQYLVRIGIPLVRPALATSFLWQFTYLWNEFPLALVLLVKTDLYNLPIAVLSMMTNRNSPWNLISAVMIMATAPVIVAFVLLQDFFMEGLTEGAIKA